MGNVQIKFLEKGIEIIQMQKYDVQCLWGKPGVCACSLGEVSIQQYTRVLRLTTVSPDDALTCLVSTLDLDSVSHLKVPGTIGPDITCAMRDRRWHCSGLFHPLPSVPGGIRRLLRRGACPGRPYHRTAYVGFLSR